MHVHVPPLGRVSSAVLPWPLWQRVLSMDESHLPCRKDASSLAVCLRWIYASHNELSRCLSDF
jgi:hypothetical protein